ncbi:MAG: CAP domain-containing protein [Bacteroidota bacterium]
MKTKLLLFLIVICSGYIKAQQLDNSSNVNSEIIDIENPDIEKLNRNIFQYLNQSRKATNNSIFIYSNELAASALYHSNNMHNDHFFGHNNGNDVGLETPLKRILKFEGNYPYIAENISNITVLNSKNEKNIEIKTDGDNIIYYNSNGEEITFHSYDSLAKKIVNEWMNSEKHRKNILNPDLKETGIGVVIYSKGEGIYKQYYALITQDLGGY